tara:strand:+ start:602 stop:961 length:360 start_codon:yes stop_codon:yes gene_type:complete
MKEEYSPDLTEEEYFTGLILFNLSQKVGGVDKLFNQIKSGERQFDLMVDDDYENFTPLNKDTPDDVLQQWADLVYALELAYIERKAGDFLQNLVGSNLSAGDIRLNNASWTFKNKPNNV